MQPHFITSQMSKAPLDNIDGAARVIDPVGVLSLVRTNGSNFLI